MFVELDGMDIISLVERMAFVRIKFSDKTYDKLYDDLVKADLEVDPETYMSGAITLSFILGLFFGVMAGLISGNVSNMILFIVLGFALIFLAVYKYPSSLKKNRAYLIESDLPMAIRALAIQLDINMPFEQAIKHVSESDYQISKELAKVYKEIKSGVSVQKALTEMSSRIESSILKRVINQLIIVYEQGGKGDTLKRIANELTDIQFNKLKEFESKMSFMGLIYIATSALLPAFFQMFAVIGGFMLPIYITPVHIWLAYIVFFPLINLFVVMMITGSSPAFTKTRVSSMNKENRMINQYLESRNIHYDLKSLLYVVSGGALIIGIIFLVIGLFTGISVFYFMFGIMLMLPIVSYFYLLYLVGQRTNKIEHVLPDALFQVASNKRMNMDKVIKEISKHDYGPLSEEFKIASRQVKAGMSVEDALNDMVERNDSVLLERTVSLLIYGYRTGANMYRALRETAEDIFSLFSLIRERKAVLSIQKYTILIGGAVLVPLILGIVLQVVSSLDMSGIAEYFKSNVDTEQLMSAAKGAVHVYLVIYSLLSSYLIASQEGDKRKSVIYFMFMVLTSIILFNMALTMKIM